MTPEKRTRAYVNYSFVRNCNSLIAELDNYGLFLSFIIKALYVLQSSEPEKRYNFMFKLDFSLMFEYSESTLMPHYFTFDFKIQLLPGAL